MSKVVLVIFSILVAIGMSALSGLLSPGAMMGGMTGGVLLGIIVLLGLVAVFVIFN